MLQSHVPELAGELAAKLCERAGGRISKVFFAYSGSEGLEAAIKLARATTKRTALLSAAKAFHGLTCGALSLMDEPFWKDGFRPMLAQTETVAFGDLAGLEKKLATRQFAAFCRWDPDKIVLAKALSGGLIPVSAMLMTDKIYESVFTSWKRSIVQTSTFSENGMSTRAGLATLGVLGEGRPRFGDGCLVEGAVVGGVVGL